MTGAVDLSSLKQRTSQGSAGGGAPGVEITEANLEAEVLVRSSEVPVVVLLWSPRSEVCVALADALGALAAADNGTWSLATVNVDAAPRVAAMFGVEAVPTVVALAAGQPIASFEGPQPPDAVAPLDRLAACRHRRKARPERPVAKRRARSTRRWPRPGTNWTPATSSAPPRPISRSWTPTRTTPRPRVRCGRSPSWSGRRPSAPDAVAAADAAPDDIDAAFAAADVQILNQDVAAAFDRLIGLVKRTSGDERTRVRTRLIELFELFDPADPDVIAGRRNLANALY